jgi:hypothetical protein
MGKGTEEVAVEWLIEQRSRIQAEAAKLLCLLQPNITKFQTDRNLEDVAGLMLGAAFSLWRAIFLASSRPTPTENMIGMGIEFLTKVLRDNSISYMDEKRMREWSFGYYLNSARFRLLRVAEIQCRPVENREYEWLKGTYQAGANVEEEWEKHMGFFEEALSEFESRLKRS